MRPRTISCIVVVLMSAVRAKVPTRLDSDFVSSQDNATDTLMSEAQLSHWLATTDASITFIGPPPTFKGPLASRSAQSTVVVYCSKRVLELGILDLCTGECTVYNGGAACFDTPHTECMAATRDVGYCDRKGCNGNCNELAACGTRMLGGFCYTYGTRSIVVSTL